MKEAEKIIEEIEAKRKRDRKQIEAKYEQELQKVHANYKSQIDDLKSKVINSELSKTRPVVIYSNQIKKSDFENIREELELKNKMIEEANDEIACLKSKLHGLRLIITQLKLVEVKYQELKKNPENTKRANPFPNQKIGCRLNKTRNNIVKTTRTETESDLYDENMSCKKRKNKKVKIQSKKLKLNIKEFKGIKNYFPKSSQAKMNEYEDDPILFKNCKTFHENMKDQRQKLMDRANRLESLE